MNVVGVRALLVEKVVSVRVLLPGKECFLCENSAGRDCG